MHSPSGYPYILPLANFRLDTIKPEFHPSLKDGHDFVVVAVPVFGDVEEFVG